MWLKFYIFGGNLNLLMFFKLLYIVSSERAVFSSDKIETASDLNLITMGNKVWNCKALDACDDKLGLEAILLLHQRLDDDANGNIDIAESDDFLRDELKYSNIAERQKSFHRNDKHITADELWLSWKVSEVHNWTVAETVTWLVTSVELPQYTNNFLEKNIDGTALPRMAVNNMHFLSSLGIKDPIHKQKISLKATDIVLFGAPRSKSQLSERCTVDIIITYWCCWLLVCLHTK